MPRAMRICGIVGILSVAGASSGWSFADERLDRLPEAFRKWLEEEVVYIMDAREREAFLDLETVEERTAFATAFWRKRDPDRLTERNEFQEEHYRRIDYANRSLGREAAIPGWKTDRGRMYIILGEPRDRSNFHNLAPLYPSEVWFYDGDRERNLPPLYLLFFQPGGAGAYRLYNHFIDTPQRLFATMGLSDDEHLAAYTRLQEIAPDLAHASITMRADRGSHPSTYQPDQAGMEADQVLAEIYRSPHRRVDTSYVNAAATAKGLVETEYMFNYVPSSFAANVFVGPKGAGLVHFSIEIDPQYLTLARDEDRFYTSFELRGEVTSEGDEIIHEFSKVEYLQLTPTQLQQVGRSPFAYRNTFPLVSGEYQLRIVFKNQARFEYTVVEESLRVPEWKPGELFLGKPVLVYNAEPLGSDERPGFRTYELDSLRLHPNAKRVYAIGDTLQVYVPVLGESTDHRLRLEIADISDLATPLKSKTRPVAADRDRPILEILQLDEMLGGRYRLSTVLEDASGSNVQSQFAEFEITPRTSVDRPWAMYGTNDFVHLASVLSALADQLERRGDDARAKELYRDALEAKPDLPRAKLALARLNLKEGDAPRAIELAEPLYEKATESFDIVATLAEAHHVQGNFARAAELFEAAIRLRGPLPPLLNGLASCQARLGQESRAIETLEQSLQMDPDQEVVRTLLDGLRGRKKPKPHH